MTRLLFAFCVLPALLLSSVDAASARIDALPDPTVQVRQQDSNLVMDIDYQVPVKPQEAWATLTDFADQPGFLPNLEVSRVVQRAGKHLQIEQKGVARIGFFSFHYVSERALELIPYQLIRSHSLSGDIQMESTLALIPAGDGTRIAYHVNAVSKLPVPTSLVAAYMSDMLRDQFRAMGREIIRRSEAGPGRLGCSTC